MFKKFFSFLLSLLLLLNFLVSCNTEDEPPYVPPDLRAHIAENTTPLESDKFFDEPDFMIYEIGGERIECTPEEAAAIYAEFERMIANLYVMEHSILGPFVIEEEVPALKATGAIRFCYQQRRKYTGGVPHRVPVLLEDGSEHALCDYDWNDFVFDEVLIGSQYVVLGEDGHYKLQREKGAENASACMRLHFAKDVLYNGTGEYSGKEFDPAVQRILRINERFPHLAE